MKASDFWKVICEQENYRFFTGLPSSAFAGLYKSMSSGFMHYIPAVSLDIAVKLILGASFGEANVALIIPSEYLDDLDLSLFEGNFDVLVITDGSKQGRFKYKYYNLKSDVDCNFSKFLADIRKEKVPGILFLGEDI